MKKILLTILTLTICLIATRSAHADQTINFGSGWNDWQPIGQVGDFQQQALAFTPGSNWSSAQVNINVRTTGSPSDNLVVAIQTDSGGVPSGTDLGTVSTPAASIPSACGSPFAFAKITGLTLNSGTQYWIVLRRSGALNTANRYNACFVDSSAGDTYVYNGTIWRTMKTADPSFWGYLDGNVVLSNASTAAIQDFSSLFFSLF